MSEELFQDYIDMYERKYKPEELLHKKQIIAVSKFSVNKWYGLGMLRLYTDVNWCCCLAHMLMLFIQDNVERINELNRGSREAIFGLTKFSDMSHEEFTTIILMEDRINVDNVHFIAVFTQVIKATNPPIFDWRAKGVISPVKDQGRCGSSWYTFIWLHW
jgi:hypothetical protein